MSRGRAVNGGCLAELRLLTLPVPRWRVAELHRRVGGHELGWVLHHAIGDACAAAPPAPFRVAAEDAEHVLVQAYSRRPLASWRDEGRAGCVAMGRPERHCGVTWDLAAETRQFAPAAGQPTLFTVRAAAIRRCKVAGRAVERTLEAARWPDWLAEQLRGAVLDGPVEAQAAMLATTRRERWAEGGRCGPPIKIEVPVLTVSGRLVVTDAAAFEGTLARGVGRHRSYGLGFVAAA